MKETWEYEHCVSVLSGEIELLKKISTAQDKVRKAVINREWSDFDENTQEVNCLGSEFASLEEERAKLFSAEEKPFYASIMGLPNEERSELSRLYRELKSETLKIRAVNETFLAYLNEAKTLASAYLEAICPAEDGKLYTRKGRKATRDLLSIVVNKRF